jgi:hypothetical protein
VINIEMDVRSAAAVRQVLFEAQKDYTYGDACPQRILDIRQTITDLDTQIEEELKNAETP